MKFKHNRNELSRFHPSGDAAPSRDDIDLTRKLQEAGKIMGIELLDHVITGEKNYCSLKEKGLL